MRATESHDLILDDVYVPNENFVESKRESRPNGWLLHIPSCYLGIAQAARDYAVDFAKNYRPNSITGTIDSLPTVQQNLGKWKVYYFLQDIFYGVQLEGINHIQRMHKYGMKPQQVKWW